MIEKREELYAKQLDDVMVLVKELVKCIKEKGDYASLIDELISAVTGVEEIPAEFKENLPVCIKTSLGGAIDIAMLFVEKDER